jgi:hypothetical protein
MQATPGDLEKRRRHFRQQRLVVAAVLKIRLTLRQRFDQSRA